MIEEKKVSVVFVPLRGALGSQQVTNRITTTLSRRLAENPTDTKSLRELVKALPGNTLIILDNAEDAILPETSCSQESSFDVVVNDIIGSNKSVKVLVTSRVKFQRLIFLSAITSFAVCKRMLQKNLLLRLCAVSNTHHAVQIVRSCAYVPLAICIAAGIMKYEGLSSKELMRTFRQEGLKAIEPGGRWLDPERNLMKMIKAAVARLQQPLQFAFYGLSMFSDPFSPEAGAAVLGAKSSLDFKRRFTVELHQRCLIDFDTTFGLFSMQPLLSQFGRGVCSEENKKIFHPRFSFYFLDLLRQEVFELPAYENDRHDFPRLLQFQFSNFCTALQFAESLDSVQVRNLRAFSISTGFVLSMVFNAEAVRTFLRKCVRVARMEKDREWLYNSLLTELVAAWKTDKQLATQLVKALLNFLEQEKTANEEEKEMVNIYRLSAILVSHKYKLDGWQEELKKIAREADDGINVLNTEIPARLSTRLLRYNLIPFLEQDQGRRSEFCDLYVSIIAELDNFMMSHGAKPGIQPTVFYLATALAANFVAFSFPVPLGQNPRSDKYAKSTLLEVFKVSRRLFGRRRLAGGIAETWSLQVNEMTSVQTAVSRFLVAGSLLRQSLLTTRVPAHSVLIWHAPPDPRCFGLSPFGSQWFGYVHLLTELCNDKDAAGVTKFLANLADASIAEKAFLCGMISATVSQVCTGFFKEWNCTMFTCHTHVKRSQFKHGD